MSSQDKAADAFRTISEVAEDLDLPQHVLRFWETRFSQIKPLKRGGGRRYYRPDDVELLRGIRHLLYGEGYTIKGVQRILKEQGPRFVMQIWLDQPPAMPVGATVSAAQAGQVSHEFDDEDDAQEAALAQPVGEEEPAPKGIIVDDAQPSGRESGTRSGLLGRFRGDKSGAQVPDGAKTLSREELKSLQTSLFDLLECKRLLDQAR